MKGLKPMWIKGKHLTNKQREIVKSSYVHRFTEEHKSTWANEKMSNGESYKPEFKTDDEWINSKAFNFIVDGSRLNRSIKHCIPVYIVED